MSDSLFNRSRAVPAPAAQVQQPPGPLTQQPAPQQSFGSPFAGIAAAKIGQGGGPYTQPGRYFVRINKCKWDTDAVKKCINFIIEYQVLVLLDDDQGRSNRPGSEATQMYQSVHTQFFGNVKDFILAGFNQTEEEAGNDTDEKWSETIKELCGPGQPMTGWVLELRAWHTPLKNNPAKMFTKTKWLRRVSHLEVAQHMDPSLRAKLLPDEKLQVIVEKERASGLG